MILWITEDTEYYKPFNIDDKEVVGINIDDHDFIQDCNNELCIYIDALKGFKCTLLPNGLEIIACDDFSDDFISNVTIPGYIIRDDDSILYHGSLVIIEHNFSGYSEEDLEKFERWKSIIKEKVEFDERFNDYEVSDHGDYRVINFEYEIKADIKIEKALEVFGDLIDSLCNDNSMPVFCNEEEYTIDVVIPALKKLGLKKVKYNHGSDEFGKDIIYQFKDKFRNVLYGGAQVKHGDISGSSNGDVEMILSQIDDAFKLPFTELGGTNDVCYISELLIICSGKYKKNAKAKIKSKLSKGINVKFIDGNDIEEFYLS